MVNGSASADYIHLYHGNASLLAESLQVIQQTARRDSRGIETADASGGCRSRYRYATCGGAGMKTILEICAKREAGDPASISTSRTRRTWNSSSTPWTSPGHAVFPRFS